jgi:hypothetical protein
MGITSITFYVVLTLIRANALAASIASLGLAVAFYYRITAFSCARYFRKTLFTTARHFFMRGLLPLLGGLGMAGAFIKSAIDMVDPDDGFTTFGPIGGVFVIGVHAGTWRAADDCLRSTVAGVLPRRDARWGNPDLGARHRRAAGSAQRVAHAAPNQTQLRAERPIRHGNRRPRC